MRRKLGWIAIIGIGMVVGVPLLVFCACVATSVWGCDLVPVTELTRVDTGNNRSVIFYADTCWEVNRGVYYEAQENGRTIIPRIGLGYQRPVDYPFRVVSTENKSLAAVYTPWMLDNDHVLVMIDFGTRETWHSGEYSEGKAKGLELFQRLKQANPDLPEPKELSR